MVPLDVVSPIRCNGRLLLLEVSRHGIVLFLNEDRVQYVDVSDGSIKTNKISESLDPITTKVKLYMIR